MEKHTHTHKNMINLCVSAHRSHLSELAYSVFNTVNPSAVVEGR